MSSKRSCARTARCSTGPRPRVADVVDALPNAHAAVVSSSRSRPRSWSRSSSSAIAVDARRGRATRIPADRDAAPTTAPSTPTPRRPWPGVSRDRRLGDAGREGRARGGDTRRSTVDAVMSRQFAQATVDPARRYAAIGALPGTVVVAPRNERPATADAARRDHARRRSRAAVYFVTVRVPRPWEAEVNARLQATAEALAERARHRLARVRERARRLVRRRTASISRPPGQQAYACSSRRRSALRPPTTTTTAPTASALDVVDVIAEAGTAARSARGRRRRRVDRVGVDTADARSSISNGAIRRRRKCSSTIDVPQEAVFAIAGDGDTLWVAGGGDGGVPDTTVSRVDVAHEARSCSRRRSRERRARARSSPGRAGVWLVGNGSELRAAPRRRPTAT